MESDPDISITDPFSCATYTTLFLLITLCWPSVIYLKNRFQVAVRLFSNRSQMTSKCGKNKKLAHEAQPSVSLMSQTHGNLESIC